MMGDRVDSRNWRIEPIDYWTTIGLQKQSADRDVLWNSIYYLYELYSCVMASLGTIKHFI